jgi:hypothetical protein
MATGARLMKEPQALEYLGNLGHGSLWRLRQAGWIKPVKMGRSVWYDKVDLDALIERLKEEAARDSA